jgi:hypothetical protein
MDNTTAGTYQPFSAQTSIFVPVNMALIPQNVRSMVDPGLPYTNSITNAYDYSLAYRRVTAGGPVELAVFVFRRVQGTTSTGNFFTVLNSPASPGITVPAAAATPGDSTLPPDSLTQTAVFSDQQMLIQDGAPTTGANDAYIIRVASINSSTLNTSTTAQLKVNPPLAFSPGTVATPTAYAISCDYQTNANSRSFKTLAIVMGTIQ